ncbi:MAG: lipid A export permease/ATP-binding protein MsbA [Gammaproteobacteria bacterium]|nr:lipid A export permease/ATP-binding protein MsbA [Gammaproteobacteria bacterium]
MTELAVANSVQIYRRLLSYAWPYKGVFLLGILGMLGLALSSGSFVALMKPIIDGGFVDKDPAIIQLIPIGVIGLFAFRGLSSFTAEYSVNWVGRKVIFDIRNALFSHLMRLSSGFYDMNASGTLIAKLIFDVEQLARAATNAVLVIVRDGFTVIVLMLWMAYLNWKLTLVLILLVPPAVLVVRIMSHRLRKASHRIQESVGGISQVAQEAIEGQRIVKAFGAQELEVESFAKVNTSNRRQFMRRVAVSAIGISCMVLAAAAAIAAVLFVAVKSGQATTGEFISYTLAMMWMMAPIKRVAKINETIQAGIAAAHSAFSLLDESPEPDLGTTELPDVKGRVEYKDVEFTYPASAQPALLNVSFSVKPGETLALVGASGSGKTTVVNLLPRFYSVTKGAILVDGVNSDELKLDNLRSHIAIVGQETLLFDDTIRNNIAYGRLDGNDDEAIIKAAAAAHVLEFVNKLPQGLDTVVGEKGLRLSGGQRQRIAIARALYKNAPILVLDEATSALDSESERHVQAAMQTLMENRTTLVIAHRLATIENADRIVVLAQGRVVEQGTHQELIGTGGVYANLHQMQFSDHRN